MNEICLKKKFITALIFLYFLIFGCVIKVSANESASVIATVAISICGNKKIEEGEVCDTDSLENKSCSDFGYDNGKLKCSMSCQEFDFTNCFNDSNKEVEVEETEVEDYQDDESEVENEKVSNDNNLDKDNRNSNIQSIYILEVDLEMITISSDIEESNLNIRVYEDISPSRLPP